MIAVAVVVVVVMNAAIVEEAWVEIRAMMWESNNALRRLLRHVDDNVPRS